MSENNKPRNKKLNIGVISDTYEPKVGGIETYAKQLCNRLGEREEVGRLHILAFVEGESKQQNKQYITRKDRSNTVTKLISAFVWYVNIKSIDVIHCTTFYPAGLLAFFIKVINPQLQTYITGHGTECILEANWRIKIRKAIIKRIDGVFTLSKYTKRRIENIYDTKKVKQVYPGLPTKPRYKKQVPAESGRVRVLYVGRLVKRKRVIDIIDAVGMVEQCELWVVGSGERLSKLTQYVNSEKTEEKVKFFGYIPDNKLQAIYNKVDVFCMPSIYRQREGDVEGLGLVFLEAQANGIPVIGTNTGGIPETFQENRTGIIVEPKSPQEIANALKFFRDNPSILAEYSKDAVNYVSNKFSWENAIDTYLSEYQRNTKEAIV